MLPQDALAEWIALKLLVLHYNLMLTPEEKAENKRLLQEWEDAGRPKDGS